MEDRRDLLLPVESNTDGFHPQLDLGIQDSALGTPLDGVDGYRDIIVRQTGADSSDEVMRAAHAAKIAAGGLGVVHLFDPANFDSTSRVVQFEGNI